MCMGALYWSQLDRIVFGADDPKRGAQQWCETSSKNQGIGGVMAEEASEDCNNFFKKSD